MNRVVHSGQLLRPGFRRGEEDSRKLTGQLVVAAEELLELGQLPDALRQLCRNELFSREILRTGFRQGEEGSRKLTGQLVARNPQFG